MKCPECERAGQRSKLYMPDSYLSTAMAGSQNYYDEDGQHHYHEINSRSGQAHCSNRHLLNVTLSTRCKAPNCDYGTPQTIVFTGSLPAEPDRDVNDQPYIQFDGVIMIPREPGGDVKAVK